jgi:hypothetical protein
MLQSYLPTMLKRPWGSRRAFTFQWENTMATKQQGSSHGGTVKDPEHDGRLKENREEGRTKGTTPGSEARAREHGHEPAQGALALARFWRRPAARREG